MLLGAVRLSRLVAAQGFCSSWLSSPLQALLPLLSSSAQAQSHLESATTCSTLTSSHQYQHLATAGPTRQHNTHAQPEPASDPPSRRRAGSLDPKEAAKFAALAAEWWDPSGPFGPLHRFNPARCKFIREAVCSARGVSLEELRPLQGLRALDVGCGGGILSESLARMGAEVHAIDITEENILAAQQHTQVEPVLSKQIRYECVAAEELLARGDRYDLVVVSEVVEHVRRPDKFIKVVAGLMADAPPAATVRAAEALSPPGSQRDAAADGSGSTGRRSILATKTNGMQLPSLLVVSTLNRTAESFAVAIVGAEYISGSVPTGTHDWTKFITPTELTLMAHQAGLQVHMAAGIQWSLAGLMQLTDHMGVNYIASYMQDRRH